MSLETAEPKTSLTTSRVIFRLQSAATFAALTVMAIGLVVLVGWIFAIRPLTTLHLGGQMKASTAAALMLSGSSLWLARRLKNECAWCRAARRCCAVAVLLIGALTLGYYLFHSGWRIGGGGAADKVGRISFEEPFRMALNT